MGQKASSEFQILRSLLLVEQAQKGEMEQQLSVMADKLKQLKVDNSKITQRNSTLERVLVFKEGEIAELQDQNRVSSSLNFSDHSGQSICCTSYQKCPFCIVCKVHTNKYPLPSLYVTQSVCRQHLLYVQTLTCSVHTQRLLPFVAQILDEEADKSDVPSPLTVSLNQAASPAQAGRVIQTYRGIVNLMAGLLLKLDLEGKSDALMQELGNASRQSVRPLFVPCLHVAQMLLSWTRPFCVMPSRPHSCMIASFSWMNGCCGHPYC